MTEKALAADPRWVALDRPVWIDVANAVDAAAIAAEAEAEEIRRGYRDGTAAERREILARARRWRRLALRLYPDNA